VTEALMSEDGYKPMRHATRTEGSVAADRPMDGPLAALAVGQGALYLLTGVWPLLHIRSFEAITGPKVDRWLVKTVGVLVAVIGAVLLVSGARRRAPPETALLAAGSALGLAAIDVTYSTRGRISKVYLLDALLEVPLALAWAFLWRRRGEARSGHAARPHPSPLLRLSPVR
jgi:hypothetical protein